MESHGRGGVARVLVPGVRQGAAAVEGEWDAEEESVLRITPRHRLSPMPPRRQLGAAGCRSPDIRQFPADALC